MTSTDLNDDAQDPGRLRQIIEEANARAAAAEARAAELASREMFRDAGLDLTNKQHAAFVKAYDGTADPDAVRAYVTDLGIDQQASTPPPPPPPPPQGASADEAAALVRIAEAARDGGGAPPPAPDRRAQLETQMEEAYRRGATIQEIDALSVEYAKAGEFPVKGVS